jgi:hypothetical protein
MRSIGCFVLALCLMPTSASALTQSLHKSMTKSACTKAGLPSKFCDRVAVGAYNVDAFEASVIAAHSMRAQGQTICQAAEDVQARIQSLGFEIRGLVIQMKANPTAATAQTIADRLGMVFHTIQDNCVHMGVDDPQHAYSSLSDLCEDTELSPDSDPVGQSHATDATKLVFDSFKLLLSQTGVGMNQLNSVKSASTKWPTRGECCDFLKKAEQWNGIDVQWNRAVMLPHLDDQLAYALTTGNESIGSPCEPDPAALNSVEVDPPVDVVANKIDWCFTVSAFCIGKADEADEAPPWEPAEEPASSGGCSTTGGLGGLGLAGLLLGLLAARRRDRSR